MNKQSKSKMSCLVENSLLDSKSMESIKSTDAQDTLPNRQLEHIFFLLPDLTCSIKLNTGMINTLQPVMDFSSFKEPRKNTSQNSHLRKMIFNISMMDMTMMISNWMKGSTKMERMSQPLFLSLSSKMVIFQKFLN